jgi:hypothetical protein
MPFRAILITLVTVTLALLAVGMWMRSIAPMLAVVNASTQPSTRPGDTHPGIAVATTASAEGERPDRQFKALVKAVMFATFLIISILFVIGFFTTLRAWMRAPSKPQKTRYVDAWKLAGERLQPKADEEEGKGTGAGP